MQCPFCGFEDSRVIDSRPTDGRKSIRRRRECLKCKKRFTTYEVVETLPISIVKKDGTRQAYEREKLVSGLAKACANRPISIKTIDDIVDEIELEMENSMARELTSGYVAELVMQKLKERDEVAYIRFASVTNRFNDVDSFVRLLNELQSEKK